MSGLERSIGKVRRRAAMAEMHSLDIPGGVARQLLGMNVSTWATDAREMGLKFRSGTLERQTARAAAKKRAAKMYAMYSSGSTLEEVGKRYNLTRERVRQLMTKHFGASAINGGQHVKKVARKQRTMALQDARYLKKYGCTFAQFVEVRQIGRDMVADGRSIYETPLRAFVQQRNNSKPRGIGWELTFWQWWTIWQESGKWDERGRAKNAYVMGRFGDEGPYAAGNVVICTLSQNSSAQPNNPYRSGHPAHADVAWSKRSLESRLSGKGRHTKNSGFPRGVTRNPRSKSYQAQANIGGKHIYLGSFPTPEAAHDAYVAAVTADVGSKMARAA